MHIQILNTVSKVISDHVGIKWQEKSVNSWLISLGCFHCSPGLTEIKISPKARSLSGNKLAVILVVPNSAFPSDLVSSSPSTFHLFPPPFHSIPFHVCSSPSPPSPWPSPKPKYFSPTLESIPITNIRFARYHLSRRLRRTTRVAWKNGDLASRIPEQAGFVCRPPSPTTARPRTRPLSGGKNPPE